MKNLREGGIVVLLLAASVGACSSGKSSKTPAPQSHGNASQSPQTSLGLDMDQLTATDNSMRQESSSDPAWSMRVSVNGTERVNVKGAPIADVSAAVKSLQFSRSDVLRLELTIAKAADPATIFATNLDTVANAAPQTAAIWKDQCAGLVSPDVNLASVQIPDAGELTKVQIQICDFVGFSLKPMVEITPQAKLLDKKTVIYHCKMTPSTSGATDTYAFGNTPCGYGYQTLAGETAPTISILKDYAPDSPLYNTHLLVMSKFDLDAGPSGQPLLDTEFGAPPFGSLEGCASQRVDVKYGAADGVKTARLTFKRSTNQSGQTVWVPDGDTSSWPTLAAVNAYYKAASSETIHLYRTCEWIPEVDDVAAGSVIQFAGQ